MKAIVHDWHTDFYPTSEEVKTHCRPGAGADTCIWLCVGSDGFECLAYNKPASLIDRLRKGETNAKREGDKDCPLPEQAFEQFRNR